MLSWLADAYARLKDAGSVLLQRPRYGQRQSPPGGGTPYGSSLGPWSAAWTDSRSEMVRHFKTWTYVAVNRISTAVAMNPPNVSDVLEEVGGVPEYAEKSSSPRVPRKPLPRLWVASKALTPLQSHEALAPCRPDDPLVRLLADPNDPDTSYDLWYETTMYLLLTGSAYWWMPPGYSNRPAALWVLPSHWVTPRFAKDGSPEAYDLRPAEGHYPGQAVPAQDVIHFKFKSPVSKYDGHSPLTAGSRWIDTQESMDRTRWASFRNGIFPGVSVEFDPAVKMMPDDKDLDRIEAKLMARYGGEANANRPVFVPPGAKLKNIQLTAQELAFAESTDQLRDMILALFGVPASIAQVNSHMTYGSVIAAQSCFYMLTLNPLYRYFGLVLSEKLAPRYPGRKRVWWEDRTPADPELQEKQLATDMMYGARTANEVRALRGLSPFDTDSHPCPDEPWMPLNTVPVSRAVELATLGKGSPGKNPATSSDATNVAAGTSEGEPNK